jgi:hypothetical protein
VCIDPQRGLVGAHRKLDVAGHYHRSDVFRFEVDRSRREPVKFVEHEVAPESGHEAPP